MTGRVSVIGGGLAGSEAAWQIARLGVPVSLFEMRPVRPTPVHRTAALAELVCSNSLKATDVSTAHGLLKEEMRRFGSLILDCALAHRVPAGQALAVDRDGFSGAVTRSLEGEAQVTIVREEVRELPREGTIVVAAGPMVAESLAASIASFTGRDHLYFFDAIAPVVEAETIDRGVVFAASRYGKGPGDDYLNCPMGREQYERFVALLLAGEKAPLHEVDKTPFFEGCLPIEEMARRGPDTLRFGPMKPVGLIDPRTGRRPYAVVQLRQDNLAAEHYSMVGFQTQLKWPDQKRIFQLIPGLEHADFVRLGQIHRNCYIHAPTVLGPDLQARKRPGLFFAGQISGVEGYTESAATGLFAGINAVRALRGLPTLVLPRETMLGALCHYISHAAEADYQPTNAAFGLLTDAPPDAGAGGARRLGRKERRAAQATRALAALDRWLESVEIPAGAGTP
jgi:methylenetetrahydrofolate--tRNA-(uracil-5-)-methyltransferase